MTLAIEEVEAFRFAVEARRASYRLEAEEVLFRNRERKRLISQAAANVEAIDAVLQRVETGELSLPAEAVTALRSTRHDYEGQRFFSGHQWLRKEQAAVNRSAIYEVSEALALATGRRIADLRPGKNPSDHEPSCDFPHILDGLKLLGCLEYEASVAYRKFCDVRAEAGRAPNGFRHEPPIPPSNEGEST